MVLYELMTMGIPFQGMSVPEVRKAVLAGISPRLSSDEEERYGMRLVSLFRRCCAFEPDERPSMVSVEAELVSMVAEIVDSASHGGVAARPPSSGLPLFRIPSKRLSASSGSMSPPQLGATVSPPQVASSPSPPSTTPPPLSPKFTSAPTIATPAPRRATIVVPELQMGDGLFRSISNPGDSPRHSPTSPPSISGSPRSGFRRTPSFSTEEGKYARMSAMSRRGLVRKTTPPPPDDPAAATKSPMISPKRPKSTPVPGSQVRRTSLRGSTDDDDDDSDLGESPREEPGAIDRPAAPAGSVLPSPRAIRHAKVVVLPDHPAKQLTRNYGQLNLNSSIRRQSADGDAADASDPTSPKREAARDGDSADSTATTPRRHRRSNSTGRSSVSPRMIESPISFKKTISTPAPGRGAFSVRAVEGDIRDEK